MLIFFRFSEPNYILISAQPACNRAAMFPGGEIVAFNLIPFFQVFMHQFFQDAFPFAVY